LLNLLVKVKNLKLKFFNNHYFNQEPQSDSDAK
jgi:hypothetical protein